MKWQYIYSCGPQEAYIIKGRLRNEGIPVKLQEETIARLYGITINGIGQTKIFVPHEYSKKAKEIIHNSSFTIE